MAGTSITSTSIGGHVGDMPALAEMSQSDTSDTDVPLEAPPSYQSLMAPDYLKFTQTPLSTPPEESSSPVVSSKETSPTDDTPDYVQVYDEPLHVTVLENDYVRVMKVGCPAETETMYHRHAQHSFFLFFKHTQIRNEVVGKEPFEVDLQAGSFYWGDHLNHPIIHKVCVGKDDLDCMDVEIKDDRPAPATPHEALSDNKSRELCFENDVVRAYRVKLTPGQGISGSGPNHSLGFACLFVALNEATLSRGSVKPGDRWWFDEGAMVGPNGREANEGKEEADIMVLAPK